MAALLAAGTCSGCVSKVESTTAAPATTAAAAAESKAETTAAAKEEAAPAETSWAEANGLNTTETVDELYEKAKEEGVLNLYGCTGRLENVSADFMAEYPGIEVNFYDLGINEMLEKFSREYEAGIHTADVLQLKEQTGSISREYIQQGLLHNYQPSDIFDGVDPSYLSVTPFVIELDWWNYNTEVYSELPITSWWDITKPEWNGKFIFLDPSGEPDLPVLFTAMVQHSDIMEKEYEKVFGEPITLEANEPDAAHAWINRVAKNGVILETSNSNIVKAVGGAKGMTDPPIGYGVSSKLRERDLQGFVLGVEPDKFDTPTTCISFMVAQIADQCEHPNAAKLFVRYLCGEADHSGKGLQPFLTAGSYPVFPDVPPIDGTPDYDSIPKFELDLDYYYDNYLDVYDYWLSVQP
jgi:iron(III) transport system substrate-binding protein